MRLTHWSMLLPVLLSPVACSQNSTQKVAVVEAQPGVIPPAPTTTEQPPINSTPARPPVDTLGLRVPNVVDKLPEDSELRNSNVPLNPPAAAANSGSGTVIARPPQ